jgi:membrane protein DedA with SNARE-associated domain
MDLGLLISDAEPLIRQYGVLVVTIVLTLESFGAPLPGESLLVVASVLAGKIFRFRPCCFSRGLEQCWATTLGM